RQIADSGATRQNVVVLLYVAHVAANGRIVPVGPLSHDTAIVLVVIAPFDTGLRERAENRWTLPGWIGTTAWGEGVPVGGGSEQVHPVGNGVRRNGRVPGIAGRKLCAQLV